MKKLLSIGILLSGLTLGLSPTDALTPFNARVLSAKSDRFRAEAQVKRQDFYVESDRGIEIFVREVQTSNEPNRPPVLLIHGGGAGGLASFDLEVPGYSLAKDLAQAGHRVYVMSVRGFERSSRPASFNQPLQESSPSVPSAEAVRDIGAVVDWIQARNGGDRVALVGWATGGHWAGMYTSQNNDRVSHLVMLNSLYGVDAPWTYRSRFEDSENPGEYDRTAGDRLATAEQLIASWNEAIPIDLNQWRDPAVAQAYQQTVLANDPTSDTRTPPSVRIPGAFRRESYYLSLGHKYWDAADITVPTLVIRGDRDHWSRPEDLEALQAELINAPQVETLTIPDGTHFLFLDRPERGRDRFVNAVLSFLSSHNDTA